MRCRSAVGKRALCCPTTGLGRHCPAMLPTGRAASNRHQPASHVSVPADIRGGDAVAEEGPSRVSDALSARTYVVVGEILQLDFGQVDWQIQGGADQDRRWLTSHR